MKKTTPLTDAFLYLLVTLSIFFLPVQLPQKTTQNSEDMVLWYDKPAGNVWLDGLFIGNGYMGGNVFGRDTE